jgi:hypothetical protein
VSHLSEFKLFTLGADVDGGVVCISISFPFSFPFPFYLTVMSISFPFIVFLNKWGLIPRMGKTHRFRRRTIGDLFFYLMCFVFVILQFCYVRFLFFVHIAIMAGGR